MEMKQKIICIDFGIMSHRAIFAYGAGLKRKQDNPNEYVLPSDYVCLMMIFSALRKIGVNADVDDQVYICVDSFKGNWRKDVDSSYKGNRKAVREKSLVNWKTEFKKMNELLEAMEIALPFHIIQIDKLECDDIIACFSGDTYIASPMKNSENRRIKNMKIGDKVYSYDISKNKIEISEIKNINKRKVYERYIIHFENSTKLKVTGEHPLYRVDKKWVKIKDLKLKDEIYYLNSYQHERYILLNFKKNTHNYYRLGYLCGAILSDGHFDIKRNRIEFNINDKDFVNRIIGFFKILFNYKVSHSKKDKTFRILIGNKEVYDILKLYCDLKEKQNYSFKKGFVAGFFDGEGNLHEKDSNWRIQMSNTDYKLILYIYDILKKEYSFKISSRHQHPQYKKLYLLTSTKNEDIKFFVHFRPAIYRKYPVFINTCKYLSNGRKIIKIEKQSNTKKGYWVYNLHVEKNNNYFANNLLAHNCTVRYYKDKEVIVVSYDADFQQLLIYDNVKIFSTHPASKKCPYKILDLDRDKEKAQAFKSLAKKIEKEASDNLVSELVTEEDFDKRESIVSLLSLPEFVTIPIKQELDKIKNVDKDFDLSALPFQNTMPDRFRRIFQEDGIITYEKCRKYKEKKLRLKKLKAKKVIK